MVHQSLFSSNKEDWETPTDFFNDLNDEFHFTLDVCASPGNAKCDDYFTVVENGLAQNWSGVCWMNPPYGKAIGQWVAKAREEAQVGRATTVCLLPARTDTRWWHDNIPYADEVRFVKGRLRFVGAPSSAPFPSVVVIFKRHE